LVINKPKVKVVIVPTLITNNSVITVQVKCFVSSQSTIWELKNTAQIRKFTPKENLAELKVFPTPLFRFVEIREPKNHKATGKERYNNINEM